MHFLDLWDFNDPSASELRFREAAEEASTDEEEGLALSQVARTLGMRGRFDEARTTLGYARDLVGDDGSAAGVQCLLELGRVENSSGHPEAAMPHFMRALQLAQELGEAYAAGDAAHMLAIAAPPSEQEAYGLRALAMVRAASDTPASHWVGPITNNLGWSYMDLNRPDEALAAFREGLEFRLAKGAPGPMRIAHYAVGCALRALGRFQEALAEQEEASKFNGSVGYIEEEIGECLSALGRVEEAKKSFREAHEMLSVNTDLCESDPSRMARILART